MKQKTNKRPPTPNKLYQFDITVVGSKIITIEAKSLSEWTINHLPGIEWNDIPHNISNT